LALIAIKRRSSNPEGVLSHKEPIINNPVPEERLLNFMAEFGGATLTDFTMIKPSVVNSARVSARLIRNGIREVARMVYKGQVEGGDGELALVAELDLFGFHELTWDRMVAQGTVGREIVTNKDIRKMFKPCNIRQRIVEMASARYVLAWPSNFSSCEVVLGSRPMPSMS